MDIDAAIDYLNSHGLEIEIEIAEKENAVSAEQPAPSVPEVEYNTDVSNLSQLKRLLSEPAQAFDIVDHWRPEMIGKRKIIVEANTAGFYTKIDDNSIPDEQNRAMWCDWGKATNWSFDNGLCTLNDRMGI